MTRLFLHESASGAGEDADSALLRDGLAMRNAVLADLCAIPGVEVSCTAGAADADVPTPSPSLRWVRRGAAEAEAVFVGRTAARHDAVWVIAPENEGLLERLNDAVGEARWIGCGAAAIRIAASKRATCRHLHRAGIPTPLSMPMGGRWIVKPDDGAGTTATRLHPRRDSALEDLRRRPEAAVEPFVEGEALSVSMLVSDAGARPLACNRQRIAIDGDGWLHDHGVDAAALDREHDPRVPALRALARRVARALPGLRGFVGVDLVWHAERGGLVIEVNPRVTCAYVGLSARLGINLAAEVLRSRPRVRVDAPALRRADDADDRRHADA